MNIEYKELNDGEVVLTKKDFVNLLDQYIELKEQVRALQEVISKIVDIKG